VGFCLLVCALIKGFVKGDLLGKAKMGKTLFRLSLAPAHPAAVFCAALALAAVGAGMLLANARGHKSPFLFNINPLALLVPHFFFPA
jgi:hypothetical protein